MAEGHRQGTAARLDGPSSGTTGQHHRGPGLGGIGAFDKDDRRKVLDDLGFSRQLVFSTFAQTQFASEKDAKLRYGGARAHNRAMGDFCAGDSRLMGIAVVPLDTPELAVEEIKNAAKFGNKAVWINAAPAGGRSPGHGDLDPVWQTLVDLGLPFMLHIGGGTRVMDKPRQQRPAA